MKKSPYIVGIIIFMLSLAAVVVWRLAVPAKPVMAFYDVPEISVKAITALSMDSSLNGNKNFIVRMLDSALPLADQLKVRPGVDLLFVEDGKAAVEIAEQTNPPSEIVRRLMPSAMRRAGQTESRVYGLPLLLNHFEVAYDTKALNRTGLGEPKTLAALLYFARKTKAPTRWPIICAGAQDTDLLMLVTSLGEAINGFSSVDALVGQLDRGVQFSERLGNTEFRGVLDTLVAWRKDGLLHPEWFRMKNEDLIGFMENDYAAIVFMPLSTHRIVPMRTIEKFTSIPVPSDRVEKERAFTTTVLLGVLPLQRKQNSAAETFLYNLVKNDGQKKLAAMTGLGPVNATAETQDRQASDVRLWTASSQKPMMEIGTAAHGREDKRTQLARDIRAYIESGGAGY